MIEHRILNSIWDCIVYLNLSLIDLYALLVFSLSVYFLLLVFFSCFYFIVFSLSFYPFRLLRNLFNKSFIICMIRPESDHILLLDVHCFNSYVHWRLDIYLIITSGVPIHFWFILYRLFHPFRFILKSNFTPCMARWSNSYRKYFSILYREGSTVETSMTVEFSLFVFDIYRRNKKNNCLYEWVTCERPIKCSHGCSDGTRL
jgi:hypothetical protein